MVHLERTQVPSKIIYIISLMNTLKKKRTSPLGYKLAHYIVTGGYIVDDYEVNNYKGLLFLALCMRYIVIMA